MLIHKDFPPVSAQLAEEYLSYLPPDQPVGSVVFWDIETTGFSRIYDSVYLTGYLYFEDGRPVLEQHLARSLAEESELLLAFCKMRERFSFFYSYNGESFDVPFIRERLARMHILDQYLPDLPAMDTGSETVSHTAPESFSFTSIDLYRRFRPLSSFFGLSGLRMKELEAFLMVERRDHFSGGELIFVYEEYSRTDDPALEQVLLLHNAEDVSGLLPLLRLDTWIRFLREDPVDRIALAFADDPATRTDALRDDADADRRDALHADAAALTFTLHTPSPLTLHTEYTLKDFSSPLLLSTECGSDKVRLRLPMREGRLFWFLPDYREYCILPDGTLLHRSIAHPSGSRKARKEEAALPKESRFIPCSAIFETILRSSLDPGSVSPLHVFRENLRQKSGFLDPAELMSWLPQATPSLRAAFFRQYLPPALRSLHE